MTFVVFGKKIEDRLLNFEGKYGRHENYSSAVNDSGTVIAGMEPAIKSQHCTHLVEFYTIRNSTFTIDTSDSILTYPNQFSLSSQEQAGEIWISKGKLEYASKAPSSPNFSPNVQSSSATALTGRPQNPLPSKLLYVFSLTVKTAER